MIKSKEVVILELRKTFLKFALPSVASMWAFSLYTMVDGLFVARGVGESGMAAVNLSMPFTSLVFMVGVLLATGTSTVISVALGQERLEEARDYFNQNLAVTGAVSLLLTAAVLLNLEAVALFLGATPDTLDYVKEYVGTIAVFAVFFTVSYNLEVQVKANGAPQVSTIGVLSCAVMNVALDALFVIGFGWGVWGAALATGLAQVTSTAVFLAYFLTHRERLQLGRFRRNLGAYRRILPLGLSEGLNELSNGLVVFLFNHTILRVIGEQALPAYTIISYVNTLVLMTMTGIAQGMQPLVSYALGAERRRDCHRLLKYGVADEHWGAPFYIDNDARLAAIGEWQYGSGRGYDSVVMMTIGTGIGSGVIMNGEVMYGKHFQAGSLGGHFVVDYKGRLCSCGNKGCVEALSSSFFLHKIIKDHACLSPSFKMSSQNYDFKEIFQLAEQGNRDALLVRNECIEIWGAAVINFIHAYDPEVVILGGGIMNSHKVIVPYIEERVSKFAWTPSAKVSVVVSSLGDYAALYGLEYCLRKKIKDEVFC